MLLLFTKKQKDTTPSVFSFTNLLNVALNSLVTSNTITIHGITAPTLVTVSGGSYKINAGSYTTQNSYITNGQSLTLQRTSSASSGTQTSVTVTIGNVSTTWYNSTTSLTTYLDTYMSNSQVNGVLDVDTVTALKVQAVIVYASSLKVPNDGQWYYFEAANTIGASGSLMMALFGTAETRVLSTVNLYRGIAIRKNGTYWQRTTVSQAGVVGTPSSAMSSVSYPDCYMGAFISRPSVTTEAAMQFIPEATRQIYRPATIGGAPVYTLA